MHRENRHAARRDMRHQRRYGRIELAMRISATAVKVSLKAWQEAYGQQGRCVSFKDRHLTRMFAGFSP